MKQQYYPPLHRMWQKWQTIPTVIMEWSDTNTHFNILWTVDFKMFMLMQYSTYNLHYKTVFYVITGTIWTPLQQVHYSFFFFIHRVWCQQIATSRKHKSQSMAVGITVFMGGTYGPWVTRDMRSFKHFNLAASSICLEWGLLWHTLTTNLGQTIISHFLLPTSRLIFNV